MLSSWSDKSNSRARIVHFTLERAQGASPASGARNLPRTLLEARNLWQGGGVVAAARSDAQSCANQPMHFLDVWRTPKAMLGYSAVDSLHDSRAPRLQLSALAGFNKIILPMIAK